MFEPLGRLSRLVGMVSTTAKVGGNMASCEASCEYIKSEMGYDRGMIYKFCSDCSGEVVFECVQHESSYQGMRFPQGDIPKQARAQYLQDPVRFIADTEKAQSPRGCRATLELHEKHGRARLAVGGYCR